MTFDARRTALNNLQASYYRQGTSLGYVSSGELSMATIESAKLNYLHKKILERYLESPTSDDEEILKLMDLQNTRLQGTYQLLGQQEHPIHSRDRWLSEAAAKLTDDGYWSWVTKQTSANPRYRFSGEAIIEMVSAQAIPAPWASDWDMNADAPFATTNEAMPAPPAPTAPRRPTRANRDEEHRRAIEDLLSPPTIAAPTTYNL
jgi:hypothetical protein